jgi:Protein of unknown function (DUF2937)
MSRIFSFFGSLADRIFSVAMALLFALVPTYMAQYTDVLAGAQMESGKLYQELTEVASKYNLSAHDYLEQLSKNTDPMVRDNAEVSLSAVKRYLKYTEALEALKSASIWNRPFRFLRYYDQTISDAMIFEPNVPLNLEGIAYALAGVLVALLIVALLRGLLYLFGVGKKKTVRA